MDRAMNRENSEAEREIGPGLVGVGRRAWIPKRLLALLVVAATGSGLISMSGCRDRSDMDEAMEEVEDEVGDTKEEIEDEVDDHT